MSRLEVELFDPAPDPDLVCAICQCVIAEPTEASRCRHVFCRMCIHTWLSSGARTCPTCRASLSESDLQSALPLLCNVIGRLVMHCINQVAGCEAKVTVERLDVHLRDDCQYAAVRCQCGQDVIRCYKQQHELVCLSRIVKCAGVCQLMITAAEQPIHNCAEALKHAFEDEQNLTRKLKKKLNEVTSRYKDLQKWVQDWFGSRGNLLHTLGGGPSDVTTGVSQVHFNAQQSNRLVHFQTNVNPNTDSNGSSADDEIGYEEYIPSTTDDEDDEQQSDVVAPNVSDLTVPEAEAGQPNHMSIRFERSDANPTTAETPHLFSHVRWPSQQSWTRYYRMFPPLSEFVTNSRIANAGGLESYRTSASSLALPSRQTVLDSYLSAMRRAEENDYPAGDRDESLRQGNNVLTPMVISDVELSLQRDIRQGFEQDASVSTDQIDTASLRSEFDDPLLLDDPSSEDGAPSRYEGANSGAELFEGQSRSPSQRSRRDSVDSIRSHSTYSSDRASSADPRANEDSNSEHSYSYSHAYSINSANRDRSHSRSSSPSNKSSGSRADSLHRDASSPYYSAPELEYDSRLRYDRGRSSSVSDGDEQESQLSIRESSVESRWSAVFSRCSSVSIGSQTPRSRTRSSFQDSPNGWQFIRNRSSSRGHRRFSTSSSDSCERSSAARRQQRISLCSELDTATRNRLVAGDESQRRSGTPSSRALSAAGVDESDLSGHWSRRSSSRFSSRSRSRSLARSWRSNSIASVAVSSETDRERSPRPLSLDSTRDRATRSEAEERRDNRPRCKRRRAYSDSSSGNDSESSRPKRRRRDGID